MTHDIDIAASAAAGIITLDAAVALHLAAQEPPVPAEYIQTAVNAIRAVGESDWHAEVALPEGNTIEATMAVEAFHLDNFVELFAEASA